MTTSTTTLSNNQLNQTPKEPVQLKLIKGMFRTLGAISPKLASELAFNFFATPRKVPATPFPKDLLQRASEQILPFGKRRLKVYSWGFHGPKVLLVHGWESQASTYRNMIPALLELGYSVIAFDAPAHGKSTGKKVTMPLYAEAIKSVFDYYKFNGGIQHIVGHSFGGITSGFAVAEYQLPIKKLVMISMPTNVRRIVNEFCEFLSIDEKVEQKMISKIERFTKRKIDEYSLIEFKENINVSDILVIHDVQDNKVSYSNFEQLSESWDHPKYITTSALGHNKTIKDPEMVGRISNFLRS